MKIVKNKKIRFPRKLKRKLLKKYDLFLERNKDILEENFYYQIEKNNKNWKISDKKSIINFASKNIFIY